MSLANVASLVIPVLAYHPTGILIGYYPACLRQSASTAHALSSVARQQ